jgi:TIR domain
MPIRLCLSSFLLLVVGERSMNMHWLPTLACRFDRAHRKQASKSPLRQIEELHTSRTMITLPSITYRAFLSYAHHDESEARFLHRALERFRIDSELVGLSTTLGNVPSSLRPIFRDRQDFVPGSSLGVATIEAIDASAALIVLCSPIAATRAAVDEEVRLFRSRHPNRPVIPVIVDGSPPHNFPPSLCVKSSSGKSPDELSLTLLAVDIREKADGKSLGVAKIAAALTGLKPDDLFRRHERHRRAILHRWIVGLLVIASGVTLLWVLSDYNRREATNNLVLARGLSNAYVTKTFGMLSDRKTRVQFPEFASLIRGNQQRIQGSHDEIWKIAPASIAVTNTIDQIEMIFFDIFVEDGEADQVLILAERFMSRHEAALARGIAALILTPAAERLTAATTLRKISSGLIFVSAQLELPGVEENAGKVAKFKELLARTKAVRDSLMVQIFSEFE